jgi:uncharacterized protein
MFELVAKSIAVEGLVGFAKCSTHPTEPICMMDAPHLPRSAPIDAYGQGGFVFAGMSHRGSLLCLPDAIWAWPVARTEEIDRYSLQRVFAAAIGIDTLIVGTGTTAWLAPAELRGWFWMSCRPDRLFAPTMS